MANTLRFKRGLVSTIPTALAGEPLFTTDTFDLYIGNGTTNTRFQKYIASGTTSQLLRGDGSLLTMPIVLTSPSNGEVLKYNGTNWVNSADAGVTGSGVAGQVTYWGSSSTITGSNNLFWDASNNRLGIGTNTPAVALDVRNGVNLYTSGAGANVHYLELVSPSNTDGYVNFTRISAQNGPVAYRLQNGLARFSYDGVTGNTILGAYSNAPLLFFTNSTERARITSGGNFIINNASTDNGLRFQVTGDGYFSGSVGIGTSTFSGYNLVISKNISGGASIYSVSQSGTVQTDVTTNAGGFINFLNTAASTNLTSYYHYRALQNTIGAGTTLANQFGYHVADLTTAVYNYAFYGNVSSGSNKWNLYMNGSAQNFINGSLGIGIAVPATKLDVLDTVTTQLRVRMSGQADMRIVSDTGYGALSLESNMPLVFRTNATERMRLDASGNLGLGVVPSAWGAGYKALQVLNLSLFGTSSLDLNLGSNVYYDGVSYKYIANGFATLYNQYLGKHYWNTAPSGTAGQPITFTQAMTLDASGNLLLGLTTSSGLGKLQVNGAGGIRVNEDGSGTKVLSIRSDFAGVDPAINVVTSNSLLLMTANTERARIFSSGNLAVGTTTDAGFKLDVNGTMRVSGASTFGSNLNLPNAGEYYLQNAASTTFIGLNFDTPYIRFGVGGTVRAFMNATGLGLGTSSPSARLDVQGTFNATGAATFSSSVTAASLNVSGASTFGGNSNLSLNQNAGTFFRVQNTTSGTGSYSELIVQSDASSGSGSLGKVSSTYTTYKLLTASSTYIYNGTAGNLAILNDFPSGSIVMAAGASSTAHFTIASTGAATFSNSVTAGASVTIGTGGAYVAGSIYSDSNWGMIFRAKQASPAIAQFRWASSTDADLMHITPSGNLHIGTYASDSGEKLQVNGTMRVSGASTFGGVLNANNSGGNIRLAGTTDGGIWTAGSILRIADWATGTKKLDIDLTTGAATFSSTAQAAGFITSGGTGYAVINSAATTVTALRPTGGGASIMSTNSNGLHIAVGTQAAGDLILASNNTERIRLSSNGFFSQLNATNPSASITDSYIQYSADVVAGNAAPHFRTENGAVIKLYQETTAVGNSIISLGGGNAVLDDTTFDGYTLRQIVKALRNQGILA